MGWLRRAWDRIAGRAPPREILLEPAPVLGAHLYYRERLTVDRDRLGLVAEPAEEPGGEGMLFVHPRLRVSYEDGEAPPMAMVFPPQPRVDGEPLRGAMRQNWHWPEGGVEVQECPWQLRVTDFMARQLDYKKRAPLFLGFVAAVAEALPPVAVLLDGCEKLVQPAELQRAVQDDPLHALCNIRIHTVSGGDPGETVMDSLGLHALGLHDVQCHFRDLDPQRVAGLLYGACHFLYDRGCVVHSGDTLAGFGGITRFTARTEWSLVGPGRAVLDLDPGPPHACGHRPA